MVQEMTAVEKRHQALRGTYAHLPALLDKPGVAALIGRDYSNAHLLALEAKGRFPRRIAISNRRTAWVTDEVLRWIAETIEADRDAAAKPRKDSARRTLQQREARRKTREELAAA